MYNSSDLLKAMQWLGKWFRKTKEPIKEPIKETSIDLNQPIEKEFNDSAIKTPPNLGYFSNIKTLKSLYPRANNGDLATVGKDIYVFVTKWRRVK